LRLCWALAFCWSIVFLSGTLPGRNTAISQSLQALLLILFVLLHASLSYGYKGFTTYAGLACVVSFVMSDLGRNRSAVPDQICDIASRYSQRWWTCVRHCGCVRIRRHSGPTDDGIRRAGSGDAHMVACGCSGTTRSARGVTGTALRSGAFT
jgi:hypothetical protein